MGWPAPAPQRAGNSSQESLATKTLKNRFPLHLTIRLNHPRKRCHEAERARPAPRMPGCEDGPQSPPPALGGGKPEHWDLLGRGKRDVPRAVPLRAPSGWGHEAAAARLGTIRLPKAAQGRSLEQSRAKRLSFLRHLGILVGRLFPPLYGKWYEPQQPTQVWPAGQTNCGRRGGETVRARARSRVRRRVMKGGEAGGRDRAGAGSSRIIGERREQHGRRGRLNCLRRRWGRCRHCSRCSGGGEGRGRRAHAPARPSTGKCQSAGGGRERAPPRRGSSGRGVRPHRRGGGSCGRAGRAAEEAAPSWSCSCSGRPSSCRPRGRPCPGARSRSVPRRPGRTCGLGGGS